MVEPTPILDARVLVRGVADALMSGLRLLKSNWRLGLLELVPAIWITGIVGAAVADIRRWEAADRWTSADLVLVASLACTGALVYLCNTVFASVATGGEGVDIGDAARQVFGRRDVVYWASGWGAMAGVLQLVPLVGPLPHGRFVAVVQVTALVVVQLVLFVSVPARLVGLQGQTLSAGQRALLAVITVVLGLLAVVPAFVVGRLATEAMAVDVLRPVGAALFLAAVVLQVASVVVVKAVVLAAKLISREP